jgi:hypothetical protein
MNCRPTRNDLLAAITSLQGFIGKAMGANTDRNPNRQAEVTDYLERAHELCIEARSDDPSDVGYHGRFANRDTTTHAT